MGQSDVHARFSRPGPQGRPRDPHRGPAGPRRMPRWARGVVIALAFVPLAFNTALAQDNLTDLGAVTNDVPPMGLSLDGFRRIAPVPKSPRRVKLLVFETLWDFGSATNRWPLVKALSQFGSWSGVQAGGTTISMTPPTDYSGRPIPYTPFPALDLARARYRSAYITFVRRVRQVRPHSRIRRLSPREDALYRRAMRVPQLQYGRYPLPAVVVGSYAMHGAIEDPFATVATSRSGGGVTTIQSAMQAGDEAPKTGFWVRDLNAYVNVLTALICRQDGNRPARVCHRSAIRTLSKQLR